ncbi:MAG TPA: hypothetical protein VG755_09615 [Nannocystaceae bacterium]|nr:hypothetical protein [Nannocystaceae bacterium]
MECVGIALGCVLVACGGDDAEVGDSSSESSSSNGPSSDPTIEPTVGSADSSSSSSSSSSSTSESSDSGDESSTGEPGTGSARLIVRARTGNYELVDLQLREYADGVLTDAVSLVPELPAGGGIGGFSVDEATDRLVYCTQQPPELGRPCFVREPLLDPRAPAQAFAGDDLSAPFASSTPAWIAPAERYFFRAAPTDGSAGASLFRATYEAGVLGESEALVASPPGNDIDLNAYHVSPDGATVTYIAGPDDGPQNAYVVELAADLPAVATAISDVGAEQRARSPGFLHAKHAAIYGIAGAAVVDPNVSYWLVDLDAPLAPGVRIDDPSNPELERAHLQSAFDDHALVYWTGDGLFGDLWFVELDGLAPQLPLAINTLGAGEAFTTDFGWSPDSRWLVYVAQHEQPDTRDLYLVDASGASPSAPIAATTLELGGSVSTSRFDAASHWLYFVGPQDGEYDEIFRIDVSGSEPGAPQKVNAPFDGPGAASGELTFSADGSQLLYSGFEGAEGTLGIWVVDIAGDEPGVPLRIDTPSQRGFEASYGASFSPDGSVVVYHERGLEPDDPSPLRLVDLSAPAHPIELSPDSFGAVFLDG